MLKDDAVESTILQNCKKRNNLTVHGQLMMIFIQLISKLQIFNYIFIFYVILQYY